MELKQDQIRVNAAPPFLERTTAAHWSFINDWQVEPQSDDRPIMSGEVTLSGTSPSAQRSMSRRKHQAMFKRWSQGRHD